MRAANNLSETRPKSSSVDIAQVQIESCGAREYADGQILCVGLSYVHAGTVVGGHVLVPNGVQKVCVHSFFYSPYMQIL